MKKAIIIIMVLLATTLLLTGCAKRQPLAGAPPALQEKAMETFDNMLQKNPSLYCTHTGDPQTSYGAFEAYIDQDRYHVAIEFSLGEQKGYTYFINDGTHVYYWDSSSTTAMRLTAEAHGQSINRPEAHPLYLARVTPSSCKPWTPNEEKFKLPINMDYQSFG